MMNENNKEFQFIYTFIVLESVYYSHPVIFFPINAKNRNISLPFIGITLSFITLGSMIVSIFYLKLFFNVKTKDKFSYALISIIISFALFGLSDFVENNLLFLILSIISRLLQGFYVGMVFVVGYDRIPKLFPNKEIMNKKIILLVNAGYLGSCISYSLGYLLIYLTNYALSFLLISLMTAVFFFIFLKIIQV